MSDPDHVGGAVGKTVGELGRIDACVANAGASGAVPFLDLAPAEWRRVVSVNLDGVFFTLQAAARQMIAQGEGGAAVSSTSAIHGVPRNAHHAASKAGVLGLVRSAALRSPATTSASTLCYRAGR